MGKNSLIIIYDLGRNVEAYFIIQNKAKITDMLLATILNFPIITSLSFRLNVVSKIINVVNLLADLQASSSNIVVLNFSLIVLHYIMH
jgi:hypothetical protein